MTALQTDSSRCAVHPTVTQLTSRRKGKCWHGLRDQLRSEPHLESVIHGWLLAAHCGSTNGTFDRVGSLPAEVASVAGRVNKQIRFTVVDVRRSLLAFKTEQHERLDIEGDFEHDPLGK
ncbi:hypothetical protein [Frankia sp. QA3]|uniref:hypothetical protein n=1 Tax=Frankia sp. QA3 TaxID=710111 RepID=UPI000269BC3C|nr:hypothetical protein [Frankia sp. QA3]EIV91757.1 hypothetical protein FraQA3DRAFT_1233 [Frankia sp. QA3]